MFWSCGEVREKGALRGLCFGCDNVFVRRIKAVVLK